MSLAPAPQVNVLVVDDDEDTSALLEVLLGRQGWAATFVTDLARAKGALETGAFSALVTDLSLPDGSGLSLLANGRPPTLRAAVVMTGWGGATERRESERTGFDAYVVKPFDAIQLIALLKTRLASTEQNLLPPRAKEER
jgi:DNA-binding response OmpR family regulator